MKLFQIINNVANADFSKYGEAKDKIPKNLFPETLINELIEAPEYVFIGWFYDSETKTWIKPKAPEGFAYDDETGTFYPDKDWVEAHRLRTQYPELYFGVSQNVITEEQFEQMTGQKFIKEEETVGE